MGWGLNSKFAELQTKPGVPVGKLHVIKALRQQQASQLCHLASCLPQAAGLTPTCSLIWALEMLTWMMGCSREHLHSHVPRPPAPALSFPGAAVLSLLFCPELHQPLSCFSRQAAADPRRVYMKTHLHRGLFFYLCLGSQDPMKAGAA